MAERRMFSNSVVESDLFLDMPFSAQALYFHLSMNADDDGFVANPKNICRMVGTNDDDLQILSSKGFVIIFESGVIVITHWKINNHIRQDRHKETVFKEEKELLILEKNEKYTLCM